MTANPKEQLSTEFGRSISRAGSAGPRAGKDSWYYIARQRVRYANLSVISNGICARLDDSWADRKLRISKAKMAEPWNVEDVLISERGIEVSQYAQDYIRSDNNGPRQSKEDEHSWTTTFEREQLGDIKITEKVELVKNSQKPVIELLIEYKGLPEGKNTTRYGHGTEPKTPEQRGDINMDRMEEKAEKGEAEEKETEGEEAEGEEEGSEEGEVIGSEEEEDHRPEDFPLARFFHENVYHQSVIIRIAFPRRETTKRPSA